MNAELATILSRYPASVRPTAEPVALGGAGGLSGSQLWRFDSQRGPLLARQWPSEYSDRSRLETIHRWISRADRLGFVPIPLKAKDGSSVQELNHQFWELVPWMPGTADASVPPHAEKVASAFAALASFHVAMSEVTPNASSPGLASRLIEVDALQIHEFDDWRALLSHLPTDPIVTLAREWLQLAHQFVPALLPNVRRAATLPTRVQPVIRDARPEHFLFIESRVTGLVDFGGMAIDTVATDLARLMSLWLGHDDPLRSVALDAYGTGRPVTSTEHEHIATFEHSSAVLGGAHWFRWHFLEKRKFDNPSAVTDGILRSINQLKQIQLGPRR